ncbi:MAG: hypothetical protein NT062_07355 [Proteobacteria bacterium]|nr:hypothetical protein [Pseudomonadota bacterium]
MLRSWGIAIFVAVFSFYLLTGSREPVWGDARGMWEVAERLVTKHRADIKTRWPEDIPPGRDGLTWGIAPIGPSLIHVPGAFLASIAHDVDKRYDVLIRPLAMHLGPAALGALACALFFGLLRDLGLRRRTASACTMILACATTTWVYARMPYSEILQLACMIGWVRQVLRTSEAPSRRSALWLGAWAGMLLNAKYVFGAAIFGGALVVLWSLRKRRAALVTVLTWGAVTGVPLVALALYYNWLRWGSITATGYEPYLDIYFGGSMFDGAWGMLLSPNKSAMIYSPPLVLAAIGLPATLRHKPRFGLALLAIVVPVFLVYCTYRSWSGDYAWGPRFFVWATPIVLVPLGFFVDHVAARWHRWVRRGVLGGVVVVGIGVQVLGSSLYWDHWIRVAIDAKNQWLGNPNRSGSYIAEKGRGHCDSCFEDTYELLWTPAFQPVRGHWWLLKTLWRDDLPAAAQADAPWRGYTKLELRLDTSLPRARLDWWGMIWWKDAPVTAPGGRLILVGFLLALAYGVACWIRLHRRARDEDDPGEATRDVRTASD